MVCGTNETDNVQDWPAVSTREAAQFPEVAINSPGVAAVIATLDRVKTAGPLLVKVTVCGSDIVPILLVPKARLVVDRLTVDSAPAPLSGTRVLPDEPALVT